MCPLLCVFLFCWCLTSPSRAQLLSSKSQAGGGLLGNGGLLGTGLLGGNYPPKNSRNGPIHINLGGSDDDDDFTDDEYHAQPKKSTQPPVLTQKPDLPTTVHMSTAGPTPAPLVRTPVMTQTAARSPPQGETNGQGLANKNDVTNQGSSGLTGVTPARQSGQEVVKSPGHSDHMLSPQPGKTGVGGVAGVRDQSVSDSGAPPNEPPGSAATAGAAVPESSGHSRLGASGDVSQSGEGLVASQPGTGKTSGLNPSGAGATDGRPTGKTSSDGAQTGSGPPAGYSQTGGRPSEGYGQLGAGSSGGLGLSGSVAASGQADGGSPSGYGQSGSESVRGNGQLGTGSSRGLGESGAGAVSGQAGGGSPSGYGQSGSESVRGNGQLGTGSSGDLGESGARAASGQSGGGPPSGYGQSGSESVRGNGQLGTGSSRGLGESGAGAVSGQAGGGSPSGYGQSGSESVRGNGQLGTGSSGDLGESGAGAASGQSGGGPPSGYGQSGSESVRGNGQLGTGSSRGLGESGAGAVSGQAGGGSPSGYGQSGSESVRGNGQLGTGSSGDLGESGAGAASGQSGGGPPSGYGQSGSESVRGNGQLGTGSSRGLGESGAGAVSGQAGGGSPSGYGQSGSESVRGNGQLGTGSSGGLGESGAGAVNGQVGGGSPSGYGQAGAGPFRGYGQTVLPGGLGQSGPGSMRSPTGDWLFNGFGQAWAESLGGYGHLGAGPYRGWDQFRTGPVSGGYGQNGAVSMNGYSGASAGDVRFGGFGQPGYRPASHLSQFDSRAMNQPMLGSAGMMGESGGGSASSYFGASYPDFTVHSGAGLSGGSAQSGGRISNPYAGSGQFGFGASFDYGSSGGHSHFGAGSGYSGTRSQSEHGKSEVGSSLSQGHSAQGTPAPLGSTGGEPSGNPGNRGTPADGRTSQHRHPVSGNVMDSSLHHDQEGNTKTGSGNPTNQTHAPSKDILAQEAVLEAIILSHPNLSRKKEVPFKIILGLRALPVGIDPLLEHGGSKALEGLLCKGSLGGLCGHGSLEGMNEVLKNTAVLGKLDWVTITSFNVNQVIWKTTKQQLELQTTLTAKFTGPLQFLSDSVMDVTILALLAVQCAGPSQVSFVLRDCKAFFTKIYVRKSLVSPVMRFMLKQTLQGSLSPMLCPLVRFWFYIINQQMSVLENARSPVQHRKLYHAFSQNPPSTVKPYRFNCQDKFFPASFINWMLEISERW